MGMKISEFKDKYCKLCGTQRCMGPDSEMAEGCPDYVKYVKGENYLSPTDIAIDALKKSRMKLPETSGYNLKIGDKVKMNIPVIGDGDLDGVAFTMTGKDYWRYMNQHPDEIYTITGYDFSGDDTAYTLSGYMEDNTWYSDELILIDEPKTNFEAIKSMTIEEMAEFIGNVIQVPAKLMIDWLNGNYNK